MKNKLEKLKKEIGEETFYYLLLCFNFYFARADALLMFENKNILNCLLVNLIEFRKLVGTLILEDRKITELIQMASSSEQILDILFFAKKDLKGFASVLKNNYKKIDTMVNERINIWDYIELNITDEAMLYIYEEKDNLERIVYEFEFFKTFLNKYKEIGFNFELETLLKVKENLKELTEYKKCKEFESSIHSKILNLIEEGKLKNIKLLNAIEKDELFNNKEGLEKNKNAFDIFKGIDLDLLEKDKSSKEDFFKKWKNISEIFFKVFEKEFINKIFSLIRKKENFHLLYDFFIMGSFKNIICKL